MSRLASTLAVLIVMFASPVAADMAPTPPEQLTCPRGAIGEGGSFDSWCGPSTCTSDDECSGGRVCSVETIGLCVEDHESPLSRPTIGTPPADIRTRTVRRVRSRGCEPDGTCLNLHATCEQARRCVSEQENADPSGAEPSNADPTSAAGDPSAGEPSGDAPEDETPEDEAPASQASSGCSCRAAGPARAPGAGGVALAALGLLLFPSSREVSARALDLAFGAYTLVCLAAVSWPGALWLGDAEPLVFGLPRALAWNIGWVVLSFVVLAGYHALRHRADGRAR